MSLPWQPPRVRQNRILLNIWHRGPNFNSRRVWSPTFRRHFLACSRFRPRKRGTPNDGARRNVTLIVRSVLIYNAEVAYIRLPLGRRPPSTSRQCRIIGEALVFAGIECCLVERRLAPIPLRQIRIGEKRRAESNEIGFTAADRRIGAVEIEAAIDDVGAIE